MAASNFGGPARQLSVIHEHLVKRHGWVSDARFLNELNFTMLLRGPEAH
ncbi:chromate transporter [Halobellus salinus]